MTSGTARLQRRSARDKLLGSETPRIWTPPLRPLTRKTTLGFECIDFAEQTLELELMPWQRWFLKAALELHPTDVDEAGEPTFRFRKVLLLVGRQNGKSTVMQALTLWRMYIDRCSLVIGTAQDLEVAESLWSESVEMIEDTEDLKAEIGKIERQPGRKMFRLRSGETYKVKAATRRSGRGLSGELVLLDELREHQSWDSWAAVTKTTNAKARAQIYGISNAGDASSVVLRYLRQKAHEELGDPDGINAKTNSADLLVAAEFDDEDDIDSGLGIFEWSAPPGCAVTDLPALAQSNPALGYRVRIATLLADSKTDPDWIFRTEVMCQWSEGSLEGPFPPGTWDAGTDVESSVPLDAPVVFGVDVSMDRTTSYIAWAGLRADGLPHVEVTAARAGTEWVVPWFKERCSDARPMTVVVQARGAPASSLIEDLQKIEHLTVIEWGGADLGNATAKLFDLVKASGLVERVGGAPVRAGLCHLPQPVLDVAAATAVPKILTDGGVAWDRRKSPTDIAPLVAVTGALWGLGQYVPPKRSKYEDSGLVTV